MPDYGFSDFDPGVVGYDRARANSLAFSAQQKDDEIDHLRLKIRELEANQPSAINNREDELQREIAFLTKNIEVLESTPDYINGVNYALNEIVRRIGINTIDRPALLVDCSYFYAILESIKTDAQKAEHKRQTPR